MYTEISNQTNSKLRSAARRDVFCNFGTTIPYIALATMYAETTLSITVFSILAIVWSIITIRSYFIYDAVCYDDYEGVQFYIRVDDTPYHYDDEVLASFIRLAMAVPTEYQGLILRRAVNMLQDKMAVNAQDFIGGKLVSIQDIATQIDLAVDTYISQNNT